jgi:flagellar biosynthesis protein FlhB
MADNSQEDRTEAATPRRLQKAREEGQVPVSRELTTFAGLGAVTLTLVIAGPQTVHNLTLRLSVLLARAHTLNLGTSVARLAVTAGAWAAAPFILAALIAGVAAVLLQTRFMLSGHGLRPDVSRISPRAGLRRIVSPESAIEAAKSLAKVAVLGLVLWRVLLADLPALPHTANPARFLGARPARCCTSCWWCWRLRQGWRPWITSGLCFATAESCE